MKKKLISLFMTVVIATTFIGCGNNKTETSNGMKVGMSTDAGIIDDKSFNQNTWEGILKAKELFGVQEKYLKPKGTTHADYMEQIKNLYDSGFKFIITPGFKFETAILEAQEKYSDAKFVLIDGIPNNGKSGDEYVSLITDNTIAVNFAEEQGGFLVGVAASLELKEGDLGFIGGMEFPAVQKFNWGFQQGVKYANEHLGTKMNLDEKNIVYQGSFDNAAAGQQIAAQMYDRGVKAIFTAAGAVGSGAISEAKNRVNNGQNVWVIGVDVDQYEDGIYGSDNKSVILTSAMKKISNAVVDIIGKEIDGNFEGGKNLIYSIENDGIGIPDENPNLSEDTINKVNSVIEKVKNGEISISNERGDLYR